MIWKTCISGQSQQEKREEKIKSRKKIKIKISLNQWHILIVSQPSFHTCNTTQFLLGIFLADSELSEKV